MVDVRLTDQNVKITENMIRERLCDSLQMLNSKHVDIQPKVLLTPKAVNALDAARATAALYVVIHHVALAHNFSGPAALFKHFGHQAVIAFFLLSGFVIFANESHRVLDFPLAYAVRRIKRIYPTLIGAMVVSTVIAWYDKTLSSNFSWVSLFATLFAQQDLRAATPGTVSDPYLFNTPLWSLSYEIWFYMLFPLVFAFWSRLPTLTSIFVGIVCSASYILFVIWPNHFLVMTTYFAIWWFGAMIADAYGRGGKDVRSVLVPFLSLLTVCIAAALPVISLRSENQYYPILQLNHLASGLLIAALLFGSIGRLLVRLVEPVRPIAAAFASVSYGLYVLHWPILVQWSVARIWSGFILASVLLIGLSWLLDAALLATMRGAVQQRFRPRHNWRWFGICTSRH